MVRRCSGTLGGKDNLEAALMRFIGAMLEATLRERLEKHLKT